MDARGKKAIRPLVLTFILVFVSQILLSQSIKPFEGTILCADGSLPLENVRVSNRSSKDSISSNSNGVYFLPFGKHDTIVFRREGWEGKSILGINMTDTVYLQKKSIPLEEVIVTGKKQPSAAEIRQEIQALQNTKGGIYYGGRPPISLLSPFGGKPITFFYELLSKNGRKARRMTKTIANERENERIDQLFNADLISSIVPLSDDSLSLFMQRYRPSAIQSNGWTTYDAHVYIKKCFDSFKNVNAEKPKKKKKHGMFWAVFMMMNR